MDPSLLNLEGEDQDALLNKFLLNAANNDPSLLEAAKSAMPSSQVLPRPGFCLKIKDEKKEKVFVNICIADNIPDPKDLSDDELLELLQSEDPTGFRIPMSIGEPHAETDKSGQGCTVYDVVVSPKFLEKMIKSQLFKTFFITVMIEGLESKFTIELSRDWIIMKNRKFIGTIQQQNVRTKSKPFIMDMDSVGDNSSSQSSKRSLIQEVDTSKEDQKSRGSEPDYRIVQEPVDGYPEFLVAEINLPQVKLSSSLILELGEDRICLQTRSNIYFLDIYLPYDIVQEECGSQFNRKTKILTITMPVQEKT